MAVLRFKDADGVVHVVEAIVGPPGPAYELTEADKAKMVNAVIAALPVYNGEVEEV
ncbi:MAG: hypothetical protein IJA11_08735 [Oscillospiraceae bacterium]|nr:hypothetical protein [Oscillospiraceae bacterium]